MKTDIDIKDDLYGFIKDSELHTAISGELYKTVRPADSALEDIVISVLANRNGQIQEAFVYVNIYIQDLNRGAYLEENSIRLRELCRVAHNVLKKGIGETFRFTLDEQRVMQSQTGKEHVITNKLLYMQCNEN